MIKKLLFVFSCTIILVTNAYAKDYYVNCETGNDTFVGNKEQPFKTIQKAADIVSPGDTVIVSAGVYYGPVNITKKGTSDSPIIFRAEGNAETIITNADKELRENTNDIWECVDNDKNIWAVDYTVKKNANIDETNPGWLFPARLIIDNVDLLAYKSYEGLRDDTLTDTHKGYPRGYYYNHSENKLYVKLDGKYGLNNPNEHIVKVAPSYYNYISVSAGWGGGGWCSNVMGRDSYNVCVGIYDGALASTEQAAPSYYVTLDGFTFETPGFAGVFLRSSDVTVKNCKFIGCRTGIRGAARVRFDDLMYSKNILIENCDYSQFPTYDDSKDFVLTNGSEGNHPWWQRKGVLQEFNYESGGFVNYMGEFWTIRNNYIHDCFDGISYQGMYRYGKEDRSIGARYIEIYDNIFEKCIDNAIEFEDHGKDIRFHHNKIYNCYVPVSWQPLGATPWPTNIRVYKNVIHNTRDFNEFWSKEGGVMCYAFKVGASLDNWNYSWMTQEKDENGLPIDIVDAEDEGVWIFNNTVIMPGGRLYTNVGKSAMTFANFRFVNNLICCMPYGYNNDTIPRTGYLLFGTKGFEFSHNAYASDNGVYYELTDNVLDNGYYFENSDMLGLKTLTRLNLNPELKPDSPLRNAGIEDRHEPEMSKDIGALNYGEIWDK